MSAHPTIAHLRRPAFAVFMAIVLVGLVAATFLTLAVLLNTEVKRTLDTSSQAQLRQLLSVGAEVAQTSLAGHGAEISKQIVALPTELASDGGKLTVQIAPETQPLNVDVLVHAEYNGHRAEQTLHYTRTATGWHCTSVELE